MDIPQVKIASKEKETTKLATPGSGLRFKIYKTKDKDPEFKGIAPRSEYALTKYGKKVQVIPADWRALITAGLYMQLKHEEITRKTTTPLTADVDGFMEDLRDAKLCNNPNCTRCTRLKEFKKVFFPDSKTEQPTQEVPKKDNLVYPAGL